MLEKELGEFKIKISKIPYWLHSDYFNKNQAWKLLKELKRFQRHLEGNLKASTDE